MRYFFTLMLASFFFAAAALPEAAWPMKAKDGRHSYCTSAPGINTPAVFWTLPSVQTAAEGGPCTVIGENDDIYIVKKTAGTYSIEEINRKGETQRVYATGSASPIVSLATGGGRLYAVVNGALQAWVLGNTSPQWTVSSNIGSVAVLDESGNVFVANPDTLYAFTPSGANLWPQHYDLDTTWFVGAWPGYYGNAVFIIYDTYYAAINTSNGSQRWRHDITAWGAFDYFAGPVIGPDGASWVGRVASGSIWDYVMIEPSLGGCNLDIVPLYNEALFAVSDAKRLLFAGSERLLGWDYVMGASSSADNVFDTNIHFNTTSAITIAADRFYCGRGNGSLYAFNMDGTQRWVYPLGIGGAYPSHIMAADQYGTLYMVLSDGRMAAVGEAPVAVVSGPSSSAVGVPVSFSSAGSGPGILTDTITYH
ncbi:MAG TPA: hypothetical protein ENN09_07275, partial [Planctomycetes bacterium]|nr:hypothetical protein [Planctomycetota bacterium]